jgi:5-methylcytosine-specific restriction endonuclease McrA
VIAAEWDFDAPENTGVTPRMVKPGSSKLFAWKCGHCGHGWLAKPCQRTANADVSGCRACASRTRILHVARALALVQPGDDIDAVLIQQGIVRSLGKGAALIAAVKLGRRPADAFAALSVPELEAEIVELFKDDGIRRRAERPRIPKKLRQRIRERDGYSCQGCHRADLAARDQHCDYFVPFHLGGPTDETNLWLLCSSCNSRKSKHWPGQELIKAWKAARGDLPDVFHELESYFA